MKKYICVALTLPRVTKAQHFMRAYRTKPLLCIQHGLQKNYSHILLKQGSLPMHLLTQIPKNNFSKLAHKLFGIRNTIAIETHALPTTLNNLTI